MSRPRSAVEAWRLLGPSLLPFADAATPELPLARLLRLSLFQVSVGLELVLNTFARFPEEHPALAAALYDRREDSLLFYEAVILLVRTGDALAARDTVRRALEAIDEDWLQRNTPRTAVAPKPIVDLAAPASTRKKDDPGKKIRRTKR